LIEADQPDEGKVGAQIDQVLAARGRLEKANALMMLSIRRVLTVEQWKKLQTIQQDRERMHHRMMGPPFATPPPGVAPTPMPPRPPQNESL
jgi:Spy/CpxP family protein refolding chaperone